MHLQHLSLLVCPNWSILLVFFLGVFCIFLMPLVNHGAGWCAKNGMWLCPKWTVFTGVTRINCTVITGVPRMNWFCMCAENEVFAAVSRMYLQECLEWTVFIGVPRMKSIKVCPQWNVFTDVPKMNCLYRCAQNELCLCTGVKWTHIFNPWQPLQGQSWRKIIQEIQIKTNNWPVNCDYCWSLGHIFLNWECVDKWLQSMKAL